VSRLRDGRSFSTRSCIATQSGQTIFCCMVSFHRIDEPSQYSHQEAMPPAPDPEALPDQAERVRRMLADPRIPESFKAVLAKELTKQGARVAWCCGAWSTRIQVMVTLPAYVWLAQAPLTCGIASRLTWLNPVFNQPSNRSGYVLTAVCGPQHLSHFIRRVVST
jgi:acyl-CoA thioesterase II